MYDINGRICSKLLHDSVSLEFIRLLNITHVWKVALLNYGRELRKECFGPAHG